MRRAPSSGVGKMKIPASLFSSFRPTEWNEESYIQHPPFIVEKVSGRVFVTPRDLEAENALDKISASLGLKKVRQGHISYLVSRGFAVKGLRGFDWYIRRSWRSKELAVLWALEYLGEKADWPVPGPQVRDVAEAAGVTAKECEDSLKGLFKWNGGTGPNHGRGDVTSDKGLVEQTLDERAAELPGWTEELLMSVLCTSPGGSVAELYESVLAQGLGIGAVYKVAEHLKTQGYVYPLRHYRVNERGPMREMLAADCRNCFFGYSNPDECLEDTLRQIEDVLSRDYGMKPTRDQRASLVGAVKSVPYASRTNRRVLASLGLMHELGRMSNEGRVASMLKKIEEGYGVDFPIKYPKD